MTHQSLSPKLRSVLTAMADEGLSSPRDVGLHFGQPRPLAPTWGYEVLKALSRKGYVRSIERGVYRMTSAAQALLEEQQGPRLWEVTVGGCEPHVYEGEDEKGALRSAYNFYLVVNREISFEKFQSLATVAPFRGTPETDGYAYVRKAYGVDVRLGQRVRVTCYGVEGRVTYPGTTSAYVHVTTPACRRVLRVHPRDIEVLEGVAADLADAS